MVVNERHGLKGGIGARGGEWRFGKGERRTTGEGDGGEDGNANGERSRGSQGKMGKREWSVGSRGKERGCGEGE